MTNSPIFSKADDTEKTKDDCVFRPAYRIRKSDGEPCRRILAEFEILDPSCKPFADDHFLYLPLLTNPEKAERLEIRKQLDALINRESESADESLFEDTCDSSCDDAYVDSVPFRTQQKSLTVSEILGISIAYEIIGDIAVIDDHIAEDTEITEGTEAPVTSSQDGNGLLPDVSKIADAILTAHPSIQTVLLSTGPISGEFRTRSLKFIAGVNKTATIHKEYGCKYKVDLLRAYFTPRLSTERSRLLSQIKKDDVVIDMFAGVGPYSIMIAKNASPKCVIANDKNAEAVLLLRENIALNKAVNITALNEDALFLSEKYPKTGDHIIMNLPHNAFDFLDTAVSICKPGGVIHYYAMTSEDDLFDGSIELIRKAAEKQNRLIDVVEKRTVRSYAPRQYNICLDVRIL